jgi:hypothetical protein
MHCGTVATLPLAYPSGKISRCNNHTRGGALAMAPDTSLQDLWGQAPWSGVLCIYHLLAKSNMPNTEHPSSPEPLHLCTHATLRNACPTHPGTHPSRHASLAGGHVVPACARVRSVAEKRAIVQSSCHCHLWHSYTSTACELQLSPSLKLRDDVPRRGSSKRFRQVARNNRVSRTVSENVSVFIDID